MFGTLMLMLKMKFFWLIFCGKFKQKTQKSICLQNQWKSKNIKKAIVVKNIISQYMIFKINFWPILKKLSQKINFLHFPLFEICAHMRILGRHTGDLSFHFYHMNSITFAWHSRMHEFEARISLYQPPF